MTPHLAIALLSAGILSYEVLLIRLLAIVQWHHFAYMVISIALLGFGASGTLLTFFGARWRGRFRTAFCVNAVAFGLLAPLAFLLAQRLPFNALEILWEPRQLLYLTALYLLLFAPFLAGANAIGLAFLAMPARIGGVYAVNLIGSGLGSLIAVAALFLLPPERVLLLTGGLGLAAAGTVMLGRGRGLAVGAALLAAAIVLPVAVPDAWTALRMSPFKGLPKALSVQGAELETTASSPLGLLSVVRSDQVPFRHLPGLSLASQAEPPPQLGLFTDGAGFAAITAFDGQRASLAAFDDTASALPFRLLDRPAVLVLGAGAGGDVLQAIYHGAARVDAVELNPDVIALLRGPYRDVTGGLYDRPDVSLHIADARAFVRANPRRWDLILMSMGGSAGGAAARSHGLSESYLQTVEALRDYLGHLRPGGVLAVSHPLKLPPRDSLKLIATARAALAAEGVAEPGRHLAAIRSWNSVVLLVTQAPLREAQMAAIRTFAADRWFDLVYLPDIGAAEANRWNVLDRPDFFDGAQALLGAAPADFIARYKFDIAPVSDDRPYFFDFFRWRALPEFVALFRQGGAGLVEWSYPILFATLVQAAVLSVLLILLPLRSGAARTPSGPMLHRFGGYFFALGLAFLFLEIAFLQKFVIFLGHPLYAAAVVIGGVLVFAGLGSALSDRLARRLTGAKLLGLDAPPGALAIHLAVGAIVVIALAYLWLLPAVFQALALTAMPVRVGVSLLLMAPLAFCMGIPFPVGLRRLATLREALVPWAWGINGCASVISAVLAIILAVHLGFTAVVLCAVALYVLAALFQRGLLPEA